ncbi:MAG: signal peptidase I [Clostridia bacterium]|nr:signal peptidase I [Clostridia bacterium]
MRKKITLAIKSEDIEKELKRERYKKKYRSSLKSTFFTLVAVAAIAVLVATLWLPVLQIYGSSMTPSLNDGEIVISIKSREFESGDIVAFYYNNKVLVKRVIATSGELIDIKEDGTVFIDRTELNEPYITEKSLGNCDLEFPYQVPENRIFVMGDHRSVSVDSRNSVIGCISEEDIVGKIVFRVWPIEKTGPLQ